jgi:hypothetical protein
VIAERDRAAPAEPEHRAPKKARSPAAPAAIEPDPAPVHRQGERADRRAHLGRYPPSAGAVGPHFPKNSPIGESDSMWSHAILNAAIIGTARIAPGTPQMYHQNTRPIKSATVLSRIRFP